VEGCVLAENTFNTSVKTIKLSANHQRQLITIYIPPNLTLGKCALDNGVFNIHGSVHRSMTQ